MNFRTSSLSDAIRRAGERQRISLDAVTDASNSANSEPLTLLDMGATTHFATPWLPVRPVDTSPCRSQSPVLRSIQAMSNCLDSAPNLAEIAAHYCVSRSAVEQLLKPHLDAGTVEIIIGEGGMLQYRVHPDYQLAVEASLLITTLLPAVRASVARKLSEIIDDLQSAQLDLAANAPGAAAQLARASDMLAEDISAANDEIEHALMYAHAGDSCTAAYVLTRAQATLVGKNG